MVTVTCLQTPSSVHRPRRVDVADLVLLALTWPWQRGALLEPTAALNATFRLSDRTFSLVGILTFRQLVFYFSFT